MGSRTMPFSTHRGQGGQCTGATVVRLWCLPEDRLGPGRGETFLLTTSRKEKPRIWILSALNASFTATFGYLDPTSF